MGTWLPISDNGTALTFCVLFGLASGKSQVLLVLTSPYDVLGGFSILTDAAVVHIMPNDGATALGIAVCSSELPLLTVSHT